LRSVENSIISADRILLFLELSILLNTVSLEVYNMDPSIKAGISGFFLAVIINLFSPVYLYFVPSFFAAILLVYIFRLGALKEGLVAAFMTYVFNDGILGTISLATFYSENKLYPSFNVDVWTMFSPLVSAVTAVVAAYVGVWLAQRRKPPPGLPSAPSPQLPPA
jgi:hypothetical protein